MHTVPATNVNIIKLLEIDTISTKTPKCSYKIKDMK